DVVGALVERDTFKARAHRAPPRRPLWRAWSFMRPVATSSAMHAGRNTAQAAAKPCQKMGLVSVVCTAHLLGFEEGAGGSCSGRGGAVAAGGEAGVATRRSPAPGNRGRRYVRRT